MRFSVTMGILLYILAATRKALSGSASGASRGDMHEAVRAMMAGYFEGDIVLPETGSRSGSTEHPQKWLGGVIPYDMDSALASQKYFGAVKKAMADLEEKTCLRFVERTNESDYLHLISEQGCYSYVGRRGGQQPLSLGHGCLFVTTVAHELLHAAGFHHEHTRPDRDTYLNVMLDNVIPEYVNQFDKMNWSSVTVVSPFDKSSVMLYGSDAFAIDRNHPTILTKDNKRLPDVYMKTKISDWDFKRVNIYYEC